MSRYPLNLPKELKRDAEQWASKQGVSLNQFIVWAVAEKLGGLKLGLDDSRFPGIEYRKGAAGTPTPVLRGTRIRVQTLAIAANSWQMSESEIAEEWDLRKSQVSEALDFYRSHRAEIEASIAAEQDLEQQVEHEYERELGGHSGAGREVA